MTDRELEQLLRARYAGQVPESETAPDELRVSVAAIPATAPAPLRPLNRRRNYSLLAVAAVLVAGGAMAAGSGLVRFSVVPPAPSDALLVSPAPPTSETPPETPQPTPNLRVGGLIAYTKIMGPRQSRDLWIVGSDGRGARPILEATRSRTLVGWTPDGADVLYQEYDADSDSTKLYLTDPGGGQPQLVETGCVPTASSWCQDREVAISADGRTIAFIRSSNIVENDTVVGQRDVVVTMDLASGRTSELNTTAPFAAHPGWSPDGRQIIYTRWGRGFTDTLGQFVPEVASTWLIDRDGQNARQVNPADLMAYEGAWSPDGARILFESSIDEQRDLYTIDPDGTDIRRLTTDGLSQAAAWTADGRILFTRRPGSDGDDAAGWWVMDADGSNTAQLLSAEALGVPPDSLPITRPVWQPLGGAAIVPPPYGPGEAAVVGSPAPMPVPPPPPELSPGFAWTGSAVTEDGFVGETATRLADGRVLIAGGCRTAAQVYDPVSGTFSPTGSLAQVRAFGTATPLRDGRVLFAGGYNCAAAGQDGMWASAELYDPATGTFSPATGSMAAPRSQHTATLLADGRVLIAGGLSGASASAGGIRLASYRTAAVDSFLATAEVYDPVRGTFSKTDSMSTPHRGHTATLLADGRVLVVGNGGESSRSGTAADLYDPATGRFSSTGPMNFGRWLHSATLLEDGRVLILGGRTPKDSVRASAEFFDARSGTFKRAGSMEEGRQNHSAILLPDGRVFIAGGYWSDGQKGRILSSTEVYDPATGSFSPVGSMGVPRNDPTATLLDDGRVLIAAGENEGPEGWVQVPSAVLYQP